MPQVKIQHGFDGRTRDEIWKIVKEVNLYPTFMDHVLKVTIGSESGLIRVVDWEVLFNGNELRWKETNVLDEENYQMSYEQIEGDLSILKGCTSVLLDGNSIIVDYKVNFDLGIPALAPLLDPLGEKEIEKNYQDMATAIADLLRDKASAV